MKKSTPWAATSAAMIGLSAAEARGLEAPKHPTDLRSLLELRDDYTDDARGTFSNATVLRGDWAPMPAFGFRLEVPFVFAGVPGAPAGSGLGDIWLRTTARVAASRLSLLVGADLYLDSASAPVLGTGKNQLGPFAIGSFDIAKGAWVRVLVQEIGTFGGDPKRPSERATVVNPYALVVLPAGFWLAMNQKLQVHHVGGPAVIYSAVLEGGKDLTDELSLYVDPGVQLDSSPAVSWLFSAGVRWMLR